jgi:hypothetical protein
MPVFAAFPRAVLMTSTQKITYSSMKSDFSHTDLSSFRAFRVRSADAYGPDD